MRVRFWGVRGSFPVPGVQTNRYGGNTSCVELTLSNGETLILDAGTGIRTLGFSLPFDLLRINILLTHLHGDHCLGLPGMLQRLALDGADEIVPLHFPAESQAYVERLCDASIGRRAPIELRPVGPEGGIVATEPLRITALPLDHRVPTLGWRVEEPARVHLLPDRLAAAGIEGPAAGRLLAVDCHRSTSSAVMRRSLLGIAHLVAPVLLQLESGLYAVVARASAAVPGPRFFWYTTPSWFTMNVMIPVSPYFAGHAISA